MGKYDSFINSFGLNLKLYQKVFLNLISGNKFEKRFTKFSEQYKLATLISKAILQDKIVLGIVDTNNKTITQDLVKLIELNNVQEVMNYQVTNKKITFQNGSVIEILKPNENNKNIRGKRANIEHWIYDCDFMCDKETLDEVLDGFIKKSECDLYIKDK
jgi:hypothetical protein